MTQVIIITILLTKKQSLYSFLNHTNLNVITIRNRKYFKSIYFRELGKVIFELATQEAVLTIVKKTIELLKLYRAKYFKENALNRLVIN
ncbi:dioxygenase [Streptococcus porcinus]|nr:hypothetical protein [Streptococcus porcinus]VTS46680.1 dioxygenase [Streptococcus porcinus]